MINTNLVDELNDAQREAVTAQPSHQLILAGAGSGKTRVLVHRIAWLLQSGHMAPHNVLAVTFTNKAAAEMRHRIDSLFGTATRGMWVGTFHSIAHRLLRMHWHEAGLAENFQILDSDDQLRLIKRTLAGLNYNEKYFPPKECQWFICSQKDLGKRPGDLSSGGDADALLSEKEKVFVEVYYAYESACERGGLVDFSELLLRSYELWKNHPDLLSHYQQRFKHVFVDEFQDTNTIQYDWVAMLITGTNFLTVVGDDDQSIYGWRGAKIENIHQVARDFPGGGTYGLEQNYRSTGNILGAANELIRNNSERLGKNLWTAGSDGELIQVYRAFNEIDEARYIVESIKKWIADGNVRRDAAILYRSNAQSRVLEEALMQEDMPYRVYGGFRFFDRAEVKNTLSYMRLMASRGDDAAFERVVNFPTRGIGQRTIDELRATARAKNIAMWEAAISLVTHSDLSARARNAVQGFLQLIEKLDHETKDFSLDELTHHVIQASGLSAHYQKEKGELAQARLENLSELVSATKSFVPREVGEGDREFSGGADTETDTETGTDRAQHQNLHSDLNTNQTQGNDQVQGKVERPLDAFLAHAVLENSENQADAFSDCVQLMTLHSAKGLEFPLVFMAGVEEGLFPHKMSVREPGRLEEERRLCYVGITRAKEKLYITHAEYRRHLGQELYPTPSRFIGEIPDKYLHHVRMKNTMNRPQGSYGGQRSFAGGGPYGGKGSQNSWGRQGQQGQQSGSGSRSGQRHITRRPGMQPDPNSPYSLGKQVKHAKFGEGVIINSEGQGDSTRLQIKFNCGTKWLIASYVKLDAV